MASERSEFTDTMAVGVALLMMTLSYTEATQCKFPDQWQGRWYQNSLGDVIIQDNIISGKGVCREHYNDYFIMDHMSPQGTSCPICMMIIQKHPNILQYRESYCLTNVGNAKKCIWHLSVEKPLHTLVKENAHPVECPFSEAYHFKYKNNTRAFCEKPLSHLKPCARPSKFHFRYQQCWNIKETDDKELDFQCLATWKDGNDQFLYGGFSGPGILKQEDMYRCFKYELDRLPASSISMAMSADASCQGLSSAADGPLVMSFSRDHEWDFPRCSFPEWLRHHVWRDLAGHHVYTADKTGKTWNVNYRRHGHGSGHVTQALRCNSVFQDDAGNFVAVVFTSDDCDSFFQCIEIRRKEDNVIEFSQGPPNTYQIGFCPSDVDYETKKILINEDISHTDCPFPGRLESAGLVTSDIDVMSCSAKIVNGCDGGHVMQIQSQCVEKTESKRLECLSEWQEEGKHYVIVRQMKDKHSSAEKAHQRVANCFTYSYEGANLRVQTDQLCNTGAAHIMGDGLQALLNGHPSPCQKDDSVIKMDPEAHNSTASTRTNSLDLSLLLLFINLVLLLR